MHIYNFVRFVFNEHCNQIEAHSHFFCSMCVCVYLFIFFPFWTHKPFEITVARNDWKSVIFNGRQLPVCVDYYNYAVWKDPRNDGFWAFQMIDRLDHYVLTIFDEKFSMSMVFYFVVQAHFFLFIYYSWWSVRSFQWLIWNIRLKYNKLSKKEQKKIKEKTT